MINRLPFLLKSITNGAATAPVTLDKRRMLRRSYNKGRASPKPGHCQIGVQNHKTPIADPYMRLKPDILAGIAERMGRGDD